MEQFANLVVLALGCPPFRRRIKPGIADGQIGTVCHKKRDGVFMTVDRRPVQGGTAEDPFGIDVGPALDGRVLLYMAECGSPNPAAPRGCATCR